MPDVNVREAILWPTAQLLEKRPVQMAHIGLIVTRWAYVEQAMAFLYDYLLAQRGESREFGWPVDGLGVASFGAVRSIRTKIDLLSLAIEWRLGESVLEEFKRSTVKRIEAAVRPRNVIAHALVEVHDDKPDALVFDLNGREITYAQADLVEILSKIADAHESVVWFHNKKARSLLQA